uniref:Uncharacterized protein n=1 Tax=Ditylenchus dipsaci TaxID=166011 RepID=A0A915CLD6_9BILA
MVSDSVTMFLSDHPASPLSPAGRSGSQGKLFKVKYAEPPPPLNSNQRPHPYSTVHIVQSRTQQLVIVKQISAVINFHHPITSPKPESLSGSSIDKRPNSRNKYSHLAPFQFNGPPKPSKSNPELVNCGIVNTSQTQLTNRPHSKTSPNCPRITRNNHDYVALDGRNFGSDEESFHRHYRERQRSSIDTVLSTEEEKMTQKPFVAHTLGRTNAFRRKLMNSSPRGSVYPVDGDSAKASLSSSNSSNSREGEQINNGRAKNQDNNKDHVVTLPNTMLNTPTKTPSKTPACSFTGPGRPSIDGGCSRSRKSSSNTVQSTFYVDYDRQDSCASEHSQESEGPGSATSRRRSGSKKFTHILTRPFSKMFNGVIPRTPGILHHQHKIAGIAVVDQWTGHVAVLMHQWWNVRSATTHTTAMVKTRRPTRASTTIWNTPCSWHPRCLT